jgi:hypothetical protein
VEVLKGQKILIFAWEVLRHFPSLRFRFRAEKLACNLFANTE